MQCQNCTETVSNSIDHQYNSTTYQNCCITFVISLVFLFGFYRVMRIVLRILAPLSWFPNNLYKKYAPQNGKTWALITGGSQGIGLGFAEELAKMNFNIILMSRSEQKLKKAKQQILKVNSNIQVKYFSVDFEKLRTAQQYEQLVKKIKDEDISILVNNVGVYNTTKYLDSSYQKIRKQAVINILPVTCMTRLILPKMLQRNQNINKKTAIINLSSGAALSALQYGSHYCSTKAYVDMLSQALAVEYKDQSVDILTLRPYLVTSSMTRGMKSLLHVTTNQCATGALADLGRYRISYGHFWHRIQGVLVEQLNGKIVNKIMSTINKNVCLKYKQMEEKQK